MKNDMQLRSLSEVLEKVIDHRGKTPKKLGGNWSSSGYRALSALNVKSSGLDNLHQIRCLDEQLYKKWMKDEVKRGDILLTSEAPSGQVLYWDSDEKIVLSQRLFALRINEEHDPEFIAYYLKSSMGQKAIFDKMSGSTVSGISAKMFDYIPVITYENRELESSISSILSMLDRKIALNNSMNVELDRMTRLIYDYWFMQFDFPDVNGSPYRSSGGMMIYSSELRREIPAGWEVASIQSLVASAKNGDWGAEGKATNTIESYCIRGADIDGLNGLAGFKPPLRYIQQSHANRMLKKNDLIVEISGGSPTQSTGRMAHISNYVIDRLNGSVVCSNFCKAISLKNEQLSFVIEQYWMRLYESNIFFNFEGKTSGIKNLMFDQLTKDVKIALPTEDSLIQKYYKLCTSIDQKKQLNLEENEKLTELRDWLLPMLMTGQVKVDG